MNQRTPFSPSFSLSSQVVKMEMRAKEDIVIGQDLTPPIPPIALSLHHSTLLSHCSSCFSPLPPSPFSPTNGLGSAQPDHSNNSNHFISYCSIQCSSLDSPLHFSSSEFHFFNLFPQPLFTTFPTSTDLRLSLRLLQIFQESNGSFLNLERINGLVTNFKKVIFLVQHRDHDDHDQERQLFGSILDGAKAMAVARRRMRDGLDMNVALSAEECALEAAVLCLVLANSVEVQDKDGRSLGVGVYDVAFSWINHSCSPNASYRFCTELDSCGSSEFMICPAATTEPGDSLKSMSLIGSEACGPRIVIRSIKDICKGEEVLITYTDLLQPKVMRQSELWSKYRFSCCCKRCKAMPTTYIDHCLQEILSSNLDCSNMASDDNCDGDHVMEKLVDCLNDAIDDFLLFSNPKSCCEKLEILLTQDHVDVVLKPNGENLHRLLRLYPLHHVSLHAYMALASAYKVCGSDLLALDPESDVHQTEAFSMCRKSAAYSLLLAGATHHLFESESSLIASVSNFWTTAGETLLILVKSSVWNLFSKGRQFTFSACQICDKCPLHARFRDASTNRCHDQNAEFAEITSNFWNCVSNITPQIWSFLIEGGGYLKIVEDPINFRWLESWRSSLMDFVTHAACPDAKQTDSEFVANQYHREMRVKLFQLSIHCLQYGAFLSTICFGPRSPLMSKVESLLSREGILNS